jgi:formylglycine-generating enzyme required for sulfatase activity
MVHIPAGTFWMGNPRGDGYPADGEGPVHEVSVDPFGMDATAVTNASFAAFVKATGYVTDAERCGWSFVFWLFLPADLRSSSAHAGTPEMWNNSVMVYFTDRDRLMDLAQEGALHGPCRNTGYHAAARAFQRGRAQSLPFRRARDAAQRDAHLAGEPANVATLLYDERRPRFTKGARHYHPIHHYPPRLPAHGTGNHSCPKR